MKYWLMKSEPDCFSIDDLAVSPNQTTHWDGVRNYQARNMMRDEMRKGDLVLFYHSNADPSGIAGLATVCRESYPDFTAFDLQHQHFDPKSKPSNPTWMMVDIKFKKRFRHLLTLSELKAIPELDGMVLLQKGSRLSVQPVTESQFNRILKLSGVGRKG
jgi:predicted RNA-binding protein with PUA-like domain